MLMKYGVWFFLFSVITLFSCGKRPERAGESLSNSRPPNQLIDTRFTEDASKILAADKGDAAEKAKLLGLLVEQKLVGEKYLAKYILLVAQVRINEEHQACWNQRNLRPQPLLTHTVAPSLEL